MGYSFRLARVLLYASSHRQDNGLCYISRGALAGTRNSSMGPPWRIDRSTHRAMSNCSYHGATSRSLLVKIRNSSLGPPWRIDPSTHRAMSNRSYHGATLSRSRIASETNTGRRWSTNTNRRQEVKLIRRHLSGEKNPNFPLLYLVTSRYFLTIFTTPFITFFVRFFSML